MQLTDISEVGIVGSGVIGGSWAVTFSKAGFPTHIFDVKQEVLDRAKQLIETTFCNFETKGIMTAAEVSAPSTAVRPNRSRPPPRTSQAPAKA